MISDIDILTKMLQDNIVSHPDKDDHGKLFISLEETEGSDAYSATLIQVPEDSLVIKADQFKPQSRFFKNVKGKEVNKRADYIIISAKPNPVILFVEMKKGGNSAEIRQQLMGAACVLAFCQEAGKQFWEKDNFLKDYKHWYIGISDRHISKQPTDMDSATHHSPDTFLSTLISENILFNKLAAIRNK